MCPECGRRSVAYYPTGGVLLAEALHRSPPDRWVAVIGIPALVCETPGCLWAIPASWTVARGAAALAADSSRAVERYGVG